LQKSEASLDGVMEKSYWFCLYLNNLLNAVWEEKYLEIENYRFTENNIAGI